MAGLEREAISAIEADVIEFSGIEAEFIDRPLRTYSSGMRARPGSPLHPTWRPTSCSSMRSSRLRSSLSKPVCDYPRDGAEQVAVDVVMVTRQHGIGPDICDRTLCMASAQDPVGHQ